MNIGLWEVLLLLLVVAIIFGAGKLPSVMGDLAKGIQNFKAGLRTPDEAETNKPPVTTHAANPSPAAASSDERKPPAA